MAGNTRGKLKEHLEGCHRNFEWIKDHIAKSLGLIKDESHPLYDGFNSLGKAATTLDELAQELYSKI